VHIAFLESEIKHADRVASLRRELRDGLQTQTLKFRAKALAWPPIAQVGAKLSVIDGRCVVVEEREPSTLGPMVGDEVSDG